ncbi:High affinity cAMP-specific and IBMX-insensitive 3',5'-cyclic phosphodiesterase 9A, partial [Nowakowskiella sp. JEL0078]
MSEVLTPGVFFVKFTDPSKYEKVTVPAGAVPEVVHELLCKVASINSSFERTVCKLYTKEGALLGDHFLSKPEAARTADLTKVNAGAFEELTSLSKVLTSIKDSMEEVSSPISRPEEDITSKPSIKRASMIPVSEIFAGEPEDIEEIVLEPPQFPEPVQDGLKNPTFDIWMFGEQELMSLIEHMFDGLDLMREFKIDRLALRRFLRCMYGIIHVTKLVKILTPLEKLTLHDLDHPGFNNAYQVNANTELAIIYNDSSPLENHHAAVLFTLLRTPQMQLLKNLSETDFKEVRKNVINCILATDMAKHGEIISKFKSYSENFNYDDQAQRALLLQILIKCSDISNEVRPKHVSEPWVDNLLEEFFTQSDKEKEEGLPTAPFMDRQKVTKPSAQ